MKSADEAIKRVGVHDRYRYAVEVTIKRGQKVLYRGRHDLNSLEAEVPWAHLFDNGTMAKAEVRPVFVDRGEGRTVVW